MSKQEYVDIKHQGIMDGVVKPRSPGDFGGRGNWRGKDNRGRGRGGRREDDRDRDRRGSKGKFDRDDWKTRRDRDQENDRRGGRGGRGDRGGKGGRRRSPDGIDRVHEEHIKAKAVDIKTDEDARETGGDTNAGAEDIKKVSEVKENGDAAEAAAEATVEKIEGSKKRALEEDGEEHGEAKKVKADDES